MADLNPTEARLELMRAVANGEVTAHQPWTRGAGRQFKWGHAVVTGACSKLLDARLITLGVADHPSIYATRRAELTEAGRAWLALYDEETK